MREVKNNWDDKPHRWENIDRAILIQLLSKEIGPCCQDNPVRLEACLVLTDQRDINKVLAGAEVAELVSSVSLKAAPLKLYRPF